MNPFGGRQAISRWSRFLVGMALLFGFAYFLSRGYTPSGSTGEMIRHNLKYGIDATPLFYTEVEDSALFDYGELFLD